MGQGIVFGDACVRRRIVRPGLGPLGASGLRVAVSEPPCDFPLEALEPAAILVVGPLNADINFRGVELVGVSSIDLPAGVLDAIAAPPEDHEPIIRQELAVSLYREEYLSFGKARELAGLSKAEFHRLLGEREVERHYTEDDLALDVEHARE